MRNNTIEYIIDNFEAECKNCVEFFKTSQFDNLEKAEYFKKHTVMPKCGIGERVYGIKRDGSVIKLIEIIDSSD